MIVISLVLFIYDHQVSGFDTCRNKFFDILVPIPQAIYSGSSWLQHMRAHFVSQDELIKKNQQLNSELLLIKTQLQRLEFLEYENNQLRANLYGTTQFPNKKLFAELIKTEIDRFGQTAFINRGKKDGVYVGQPVLNFLGLIGQIISVNEQNSKVLLITSKKSAVPVMVIRSGLQIIATGKGEPDVLELANVPATADIKVGDKLITSGLGQIFPSGFYVGEVKFIKRMDKERFMQVKSKPNDCVNKSLQVLLIWPNQHANEG